MVHTIQKIPFTAKSQQMVPLVTNEQKNDQLRNELLKKVCYDQCVLFEEFY